MGHTVDSPNQPIIVQSRSHSQESNSRESRQGQLQLSGPLGRGWWVQVFRAAEFSPGPRGQQPNTPPTTQPASFSTHLCPASCRLQSALFLLHVPTRSYLKRPLRLPWAPTQPGPPGQQPSPDSATSNHSLSLQASISAHMFTGQEEGQEGRMLFKRQLLSQW